MCACLKISIRLVHYSVSLATCVVQSAIQALTTDALSLLHVDVLQRTYSTSFALLPLHPTVYASLHLSFPDVCCNYPHIEYAFLTLQWHLCYSSNVKNSNLIDWLILGQQNSHPLHTQTPMHQTHWASLLHFQFHSLQLYSSAFTTFRRHCCFKRLLKPHFLKLAFYL